MRKMQKGLTDFSDTLKTPTLLVSLFLAFAFVLAGTVFPERFGVYMDFTFNWMVANLGWSFLFGGSIFLLLIVYLMLSPLGDIKLGGDYEKTCLFQSIMVCHAFQLRNGDWPAFLGCFRTDMALYVATL